MNRHERRKQNAINRKSAKKAQKEAKAYQPKFPTPKAKPNKFGKFGKTAGQPAAIADLHKQVKAVSKENEVLRRKIAALQKAA